MRKIFLTQFVVFFSLFTVNVYAQHFLPLEKLTNHSPLFDKALNNSDDILSWDPKELFSRPLFTCKDPTCLTIEEATKDSLRNSFITEEGFQELYQARQRVLLSASNLMPRIQIQLGLGTTMPLDLGSMVGNLVGFLIPSHWFDWKESQLIYSAEKMSYLNLLQDEVYQMESLYYNLDRLDVDREIYNFYIKHVRNFISLLNYQNQISGQIPQTTFTYLERFSSQLETEIFFLDHIMRDVTPGDLSVALGRIPTDQGQLQNVGIVPPYMLDLSKLNPFDIQNFWPRVYANSSTRKSLEYLKMAAKYSKFSRMFNFLGSGNGPVSQSAIGISFGLDNIVQVSIANSEIKAIENKIEQYKAELYRDLGKSIDNFNAALDLSQKYHAGMALNQQLFDDILKEYTYKRNLDVTKFLQVLEWSLQTELSVNFINHYAMLMLSQINRFALDSPKYIDLNKYIPERGKPHRLKDFKKYNEDKEILKDIEAGKITLE